MFNEVCKSIFKEIENINGKAFFVGGCVRDYILGVISKDIDIEVYNVSYQDLQNLLSRFGKVDLVGKSFGIIKLQTSAGEFDFSLPRLDSKNGIGHKGFNVLISSNLSMEEAAKRRDFTINAISMDINGTVYDPYNGKAHLDNKILNPTSIHFKEDALRVLRSFKFSARYGFEASQELIDAAKEIRDDYFDLPVERVWKEWEDWANKGKEYSKSLKLLVDTSWIRLYPEIYAILNVPQDKIWHPEGGVFSHSGYVLDAMHEICEREKITGEDRLVLIFAALCHDFGKATHTVIEENGRITSRGHESASGPLAKSFLESIGTPIGIIEKVVPLVVQHMAASIKMSDKAIRRLSVRLGKASIRELLLLIEADQSGRPPRPKGLNENGQYLRKRAEELGLLHSKPEAIIRGADIVAAGYAPGPIVGKIQRKLFEMQVEGKFVSKEQGLKLIHSFVRSL